MYLTNGKSRLNFSLCFGPSCFFEQIVLNKLFSAFFINLQLDWWSETFIKVSTQENFWKSTVNIKLNENWLKIFELSCPVLNLPWLVLWISSDFAPNIIYKQDRFIKTFLQNDFKLVPDCRNSAIEFDLGLILLPTKKNSIFQEAICKRYMFNAFGSDCFKMIFALLTEVVALFMQVTIKQVRISSFERPIEIFFGPCWHLFLGLLNTGFNELSE